ncbi:hypothetical protein AX14_003595 [Amanita brunnescens Koide BX004]|nr:hypothetical protein AX14_003595 [Amanita brunnescens Koide BX004]
MVKETSTSIQFPWEQVKAESMRAVCRELGFNHNSTRSVMTHFLESVSKIGLPRALAQDISGREGAKKSLSNVSTPSRKRTRANDVDGDDNQATTSIIATRTASSKKRTAANSTPTAATATKSPRRGKREPQADQADLELLVEQQPHQPSPAKRYRITVTSDYNTRFKADRRGRTSDPGPRGGRRRPRAVSASTGGATAKAAVSAIRPSRRGPAATAAARARTNGRRGARRRAVSVPGRRVRLVEPASSETAEDGDDEGAGGAVVVARRFVPGEPARKRRASAVLRVNGAGVSDEEGQGSAKRARRTSAPRGRRPASAGKRAGRAGPGYDAIDIPKMVFDGIDVPPLSKAVVEAIRKREMVLYDEDADGEVDETVEAEEGGEEGGEEGAEEGAEEGGEEGAEEGGEEGAEEGGEESTDGKGITPEDHVDGGAEVVPESMPVDEPVEGQVEGEGDEEEEQQQLEDLIPDDSSSLGNSNKENEAPEDEMGEEQETMEMDTIGVTMITTTDIEEEMSSAGHAAAEALFGTSASTSVPVHTGIENGGGEGEEDFLT